ncbi:conserved hypothetical protein [Chloroherpeton thalassium ATCC 35110]|uniref:Uncharacterized protein n=1 Tax=Chloroherpeton thalassium (strain ATCC 35110 / GB-78) TaxID=517418 RepID=B3QTL3_CHLT3|nr:hypothetical protein [Chloroherpeton thalassium]ACF12759.1 conserved hypothetical protein [Chloroherpeton thalassium ATCC 35110]
METIKLYAAKHAEEAHIQEFFRRNLLQLGERPIAAFDGFFYESKNEQIGSVAFQDYLIFSDKSLYLWARGADKDYLDRFDLGTVSITAKQRDKNTSTVEIVLNRKAKESIYLVFDLVPVEEAEKIVLLQVLIETVLEEHLGKNYLEEIPQEIADKIYTTGIDSCPPKVFELAPYQNEGNEAVGTSIPPQSSMGIPGMGYVQNFQDQSNNSHIGYGQDLLEQFKARHSFSGYQGGAAQQGSRMFGNQQYPGSMPFNSSRPFGQNPQNMSPNGAQRPPEIDMATMKQMSEMVKELIASIPEEYKEQFKHDLRKIPENFQKLPDNFVESVNALNELLQNVSSNKQTQDFLIDVIQAAVKSDGLFGAASKFVKTVVPTPPMPGNRRKNEYERKDSFGGKVYEDGSAKTEKSSEAKKPIKDNSDSIWQSSKKEEASDDDSSSRSRRKKIKVKSDNG